MLLTLPALLLAVALLVAAASGHAPYFVTRDPAAIHESNPFYGVASNVGVLLWCAAGSICLFSASRLAARAPQRRFLLAAGALTMWLMLDDLFMLHERLLPDDLGVPQPLLFALYGAVTGSVLVRFRRLILAARPAMLAAALCFFAASMLIDQGPGEWHRWSGLVIVEDGCKLFGIALWFGYCVQQAARALDALPLPLRVPGARAHVPRAVETPDAALHSR